MISERQIAKEPLEFIVILKDGRELNVTKKKKEVIESWKKEKSRNDFVIITDSYDPNITLFQGEIGEVKEIRQRIYTGATRKYVCDHGGRHSPYEECKCTHTFGCFFWTFQKWLTDRGYKIIYSSDISQSMRNEYLHWKHKNNIKWNNGLSVTLNSD